MDQYKDLTDEELLKMAKSGEIQKAIYVYVVTERFRKEQNKLLDKHFEDLARKTNPP